MDIDVEEETWVTPDGTNVFDVVASLGGGSRRLDERELWLAQHSVNVRYRCLPETSLTPLDLNYGSTAASENDGDDEILEEFYDGTGTMVWLGAQALAWSLDQDVRGLYSLYLDSGQTARPKIVCELGCGTGLAGIAALVLAKANKTTDGTDMTITRASANSSLLPPKLSLMFTDSDQESLDNCRTNCQLNSLPTESYSQHVLRWGVPDTYPRTLVDVVLAADVLYDMKMVPSLFKTASSILRTDARESYEDSQARSGGVMVLSHVPRFCLPSRKLLLDNSAEGKRDSHQCLEDFILEQASLVNFELLDKFRPFKFLKPGLGRHQGGEDKKVGNPAVGRGQEIDLQRLEQMHSVIYIFQKREAR